MDDRTKTIAAISIIVGCIVFVFVVIGVVVTGKKVISPVPESGAIKIIFVSPTAIPTIPTTGAATATPKTAR